MLKVTTWVQHSIDSHPFRSMSIGHPIPEKQLCQNLTLKIKFKVKVQVKVERHAVGVTSHRFTSLPFHVNRPPIPEILHFQNLTLKIQGQGQITMMLHNYRSGQFYRTSNCINPSSGFRDMGSAKSGPSATWFDKFLPHGQAHMGQTGK